MNSAVTAGIEASSTGGAGALCVYGFAISGQPSGPVYASLNFTDAGGVNSGSAVFAGVPVGQTGPLGRDNFTPALALTNFGTAQVKATVTLAVTGDSGPNGKKLATLTVPGQSSMTVPLGSLTGDAQLRNSVMVQSDAAKGALYASMVVFGGTTVPRVQLLGRDSMQPYNGGAHPWTTTAAGETSTLVLFNYASTPQPFYVAISAGDMLWQQKYQLAALETKTLDIGNLVAAQTKDENGRFLPANATAGVAHWFTPNFGQGSGRLLVSQPSAGMARNFGCGTSVSLCGDQYSPASSSLSNSSVTIVAGQTGQMGPYQASLCTVALDECSGDYAFLVGCGANWTSSNPQVATFMTASDVAEVTINGNTAGSAQITATPLALTQYDIYNDGYRTCYAAPQVRTATVYDPAPSNVSISPTSFTVGTPASFTITGNNLGTNCPTLTFPFQNTYSLSSCQNQQVTGTLTANAAGSGNWTFTSTGFGGQAFAQEGPSDPPTTTPATQVKATGATCPSTVSLVDQTALTLQSGKSNNFPSNLTGFGVYVDLQVSDPTKQNWEGNTLTETVTTVSNTCPAPIACDTGGSEFTIGIPYSTQQPFGITVPWLPATNGFWDMHTTAANYDVMSSSAQGATCQLVCSQTYSCGGTQLKGPSGPGVFTITRSATHTTIKKTSVTVITGTVSEN